MGRKSQETTAPFICLGFKDFEIWLEHSQASLVAQMVKKPPAMWETWV